MHVGVIDTQTKYHNAKKTFPHVVRTAMVLKLVQGWQEGKRGGHVKDAIT